MLPEQLSGANQCIRMEIPVDKASSALASASLGCPATRRSGRAPATFGPPRATPRARRWRRPAAPVVSRRETSRVEPFERKVMAGGLRCNSASADETGETFTRRPGSPIRWPPNVCQPACSPHGSCRKRPAAFDNRAPFGRRNPALHPCSAATILLHRNDISEPCRNRFENKGKYDWRGGCLQD